MAVQRGSSQRQGAANRMSTEPTMSKGDHAAALAADYHQRCGANTGWLSYHLSRLTPFGLRLLNALAECEMRVPGLGHRFVADLHAVRYVPAAQDESAWKARFEELIQKLSEVLVARALCAIEWPAGTVIEFEPANPTNGKRPEFSVVTPERTWLFEVKCPSFIAHQERRAVNAHQLPIRGFMRDLPQLRGETVTLPRDNTLKDFLTSAQEKFEEFSKDDVTGVLVVVWDTRMYEAIGVLCHPEAGLLTDKSWFRKDGEPVTFPDVSGVIVINRLEQLKLGAQERLDQLDPFELGGADALPNSWCPNRASEDLDPLIARGFDAYHFEATAIGADYSIMDYVMWFEAPADIRRRAVRNRRRRRIAELRIGTSSLAYQAACGAGGLG